MIKMIRMDDGQNVMRILINDHDTENYLSLPHKRPAIHLKLRQDISRESHSLSSGDNKHLLTEMYNPT